MDKKIYKFSYGKKINFVVNRLLIILINSFFCVIFAFILIFIYGIVESNFGEDGNVKPIAIILFSIIALAAILTFVTFFQPQNVIIDKEYLLVHRRFLNWQYIARGYNDKILINNIVACKAYDGIRPAMNNSSWMPLSILYFNWDDLVEINTTNKRYLIPVENSKNFIEEINKRIKSTKSKENDETSQSAVPTNMFQFDLQRGYMPDCDEIALGVNGVEFKTDKATADLINVKSISYNDIQLCKKSDKHSINGIDSDNIVEITTATQTYYIPIKNPYDFINELYKKLNTCNR